MEFSARAAVCLQQLRVSQAQQRLQGLRAPWKTVDDLDATRRPTAQLFLGYVAAAEV